MPKTNKTIIIIGKRTQLKNIIAPSKKTKTSNIKPTIIRTLLIIAPNTLEKPLEINVSAYLEMLNPLP
ncbi:MAG: hypothetical protein WC269_05690 [Candidatus Gracilibacteria bacterium]